ncbi:MAG: DNA-processing protein DprA [Lachnospiraceae bacterium]|nr:DNA-processing protein DprA [Lachnospiraceae bacterium]
MEDILYDYWFCNIGGVGNVTRNKLLDEFGSTKMVYEANNMQLEKYLKPAVLQAFFESKNEDKIALKYEDLIKQGIKFVSYFSEEYPTNLRNIYDYPYGLYFKGNMTDFKRKTVAIVGARDCTNYGYEMSKYIGEELSGRGINVVSGMAKGVDRAAHVGCLKGTGAALAVLGCGVDICYPRENIDIYMEIQKRGAIISEYPPGTKPLAGYFPVRNRIISGMADAVIIIEAREKSGSLITIDQALEQGREVFALPGRFTDSLSKGTNELIKNGANIITDMQDIFDFLGANLQDLEEKNKKINISLAKNEKMVYSCLDLLPKNLNDIFKECQLDYDEIHEAIIELIIKGLAVETSKNYYAKTME